MVGLSETNSTWSNQYVRDGFDAAVKQASPLNRTEFSSPSETVETLDVNETSQAGGTTTTVYGGWTNRLLKSEITDPTGLGRWSGITLGGKKEQSVSIITAYRVCSQSRSSAGEGTVFAREWDYFRTLNDARPNPRQRFLQDLKALITKLQKTKGREIILSFDANEFLHDTSVGEFATSLDLADLHATAPSLTTCQKSTHGRIDYMLGSSGVVSSMIQHGTLSYAEGLTSDHRGLFVDIDFPQLLQLDTVNHIIPAAGRLLRSGNPETRDRYLDQVNQYYEAHRMFERLDLIIQNQRRYSKPRLRRLLNKLDADIGRAMESGEKCLHTPAQKFQFSPTLRMAGLIQQYWRTRFKDHFQDTVSERTFQTIEDEIYRYDQDFALPDREKELIIDEIRVGFTAATTALRKAQRNAGFLRYHFQLELVEKYRAEGDYDRMKIVENNMAAESCRAMFRKIGNDMKPQQRGSVNQLIMPHHPTPEVDALLGPHQVMDMVPEEEIKWEHVFDQGQIEDHLLDYNRASFRKGAESELGSGVIYDALKFSSLSKAGTDILAGVIPPSWKVDDPRLVEFLSSFAIPDVVKNSPPVNTQISEDDFVYGIKGWRESTSTSPSKRHLGHYHALINDPALLSFYVKFLNLLVENGLSLDRWQNSINVLIEKDPGIPCVHRLRIIHLFEADYNFILKLLWGSRIVKHGEKLRLFNNNQHGSRRNRTSLDPVHLQLLSMDLCRLLKLNMASFDNDARACYDRIIVALGMLAARRLGMPVNAIRTHATSLKLMKYFVKTVYGISEMNYKGTPLEPLFGTGQGSGASPAVWLTLVVLLLDCLDTLITSRMKFQSPDGKTFHERLAEAFVDDTSMGHTDDGSLRHSEMIKELQHIAQTWEKLLHYSGGALNLKKCHWWLLFWEWIDGRPTLRPRRDTDPTIQLTTGQSTTNQTIKRRDVDQANRILGVYLAPSGDFSKQLKILRTKAKTYAIRLRKSRLTPGETYTFYRTTYLPAMTYVLPAVACDEEELHTVQAAVIPSLLQKLGAHSKYPIALRHGPTLATLVSTSPIFAPNQACTCSKPFVIRSLPVPSMAA